VADTEVGAAQTSATLALHEHRRLDVDLRRDNDAAVSDAGPSDGSPSDGSPSDGGPSDGSPGDGAGGGIWQLMASGTSQNLLGIGGVTPDDLFIVGGSANTGFVMRGSNETWSAEWLGSWLWTGVWGTASNNVYATSVEGTTWRFDGAAWSQGAYLGGALHAV